MKEAIRNNKELIKALIIIAVFYLFLFAVGIGCPIKYIFGISCAGCGMTRALWNVASLHFSRAFSFHPLWPLVPFTVLWIGLKPKLDKRLYKVVIASIIGLFLLVYLVRMIDPTDTIVVFQPGNGILLKRVLN